jgi:hypothetical protein
VSDDRASRLRERRRSSKARANDTERPDENGDGASTDEASKDERSTGDASAEESPTAPSNPTESEGSVKDEQVGTYMYLPESQKRELSRVFNVTKAEYEYEFDEEFEKNRHFYPLLVQFGIETLDDASATEVRALLDELDCC